MNRFKQQYADLEEQEGKEGRIYPLKGDTHCCEGKFPTLPLPLEQKRTKNTGVINKII